MPLSEPPSNQGTPPVQGLVDQVLSNLTGDNLQRPPFRQLREDVRNRREEFKARLGTKSLHQIHREFVAELKKRGFAPISYNTLRSWIGPLT